MTLRTKMSVDLNGFASTVGLVRNYSCQTCLGQPTLVGILARRSRKSTLDSQGRIWKRLKHTSRPPIALQCNICIVQHKLCALVYIL